MADQSTVSDPSPYATSFVLTNPAQLLRSNGRVIANHDCIACLLLYNITKRSCNTIDCMRMGWDRGCCHKSSEINMKSLNRMAWSRTYGIIIDWLSSGAHAMVPPSHAHHWGNLAAVPRLQRHSGYTQPWAGVLHHGERHKFAGAGLLTGAPASLMPGPWTTTRLADPISRPGLGSTTTVRWSRWTTVRMGWLDLLSGNIKGST